MKWKLTVETVYIVTFEEKPSIQFLDNCVHISGNNAEVSIPSDHVWILEEK